MRLILCLIFSICVSKSFAGDDLKFLTMVYKPIAKHPYIQKYPDNSGLYFDMMKMAVEKIGHYLKVVRVPKARGYAMLKDGSADLYASGEFRNYRSTFLYYFPNGLYRNEEFVCLTSKNIPDIERIEDLNKYKLTWFVERGSSWPLKAKELKIRFTELKDTTIQTSLEFFSAKRPAMFLVSKQEIDHYKKSLTEQELKNIKFKEHKDCGISKHKKLYVGFSRFSKFYKEEDNKDYTQSEKISAKNLPYKPTQNSIAYKLEKAFEELIESGQIDHLIKKYNISSSAK